MHRYAGCALRTGYLAFLCLAAGAPIGLAGDAGVPIYANGHSRIIARLGERKVILHDGQYGLKYFPDGAIALVRSTPSCRVLMSAGVSSWLLEGRDIFSLVPVRKVLEPGNKGAFDNSYAGISGAYYDTASDVFAATADRSAGLKADRHPGLAAKTVGELLAFYHAEDQEEMGRLFNGVPGFYCSIGLAVSKDDGLSFTKLGPVITSSLPKDPNRGRDQGCGEVCVLPDARGDYLYAYYTDHSRVDQQRGVQICMARGLIADRGRPGAWSKFYEGSFSQPGLGGKETPIVSARDMEADAILPHVTYSKPLKKYVMVFNINAYRELTPGRSPDRSGIYIAFSDDGLSWSKPARLIADYSICRINASVSWHPALVWSDGAEGATAPSAWLCYAYSERWGHKPPQKGHYWVGQRLTLSVEK